MFEQEIYQKPPLVTVFGGSGFVGRYVVEHLAKRGYRIRIACRYPEKAYSMLQIGDVGQTQMVKADVGDKNAVLRALNGASVAVYLAGISYQKGKNTFRKVYSQGAENVALLAAEAGIKLIHISALSAGLGERKGYLRSKFEGEERVHKAHKHAIIMRPSIIFGAEDRFFNRFANWARFTPVLPLFGRGKAKFQPVYVGDIAEAIACAVDGTGQEGHIYELAGPEVLSFRALMEDMLETIRRRRCFVSIPMPLAVLWGGLCGLAGKIPFIPTIMTAGQIRMLSYDSVVSAAAHRKGLTLEGLGIPPTALEACLATYLWRFRIAGQFSQALG